MASGGSFKKFRIFALLLVLFFVAFSSWLTKLRTTDWDRPLWVIVYPINGDGSMTSAIYIDSLERAVFKPIALFLKNQAAPYALETDKPITIRLAPPINELPPTPPPQAANPLEIVWWSLKMRYWAYRVDNYKGPANDIQIFVKYFDPEEYDVLDHSIGLQKGLIGIVNAYATPQFAAKNNVIITHEFLHTLGATDKYDPTTNHPLHPEGYAEPDKKPLLPQRKAEIMGGRVPINEVESVIPKSLKYTLIGAYTAIEISWLE